MKIQLAAFTAQSMVICCAAILFASSESSAQSHCLSGCEDGTRSSVRFDPLRAEVAFDTLFNRVTQLESLLDSLAESGAFAEGNGAFACGTSRIEFDGYAYRTVEIAGRCWFAENLRSTHYANGDAIATASNVEDWLSLNEGGQVHYESNPINFGCPYGRLYNWSAVEDERGLCPTGWQVPSDSEVPGLEYADYLSSPSDVLPWSGTNSSGFSMLPGGRVTTEGFEWGNTYGYLWTRTETSETTAQWRGFIDVYYSDSGDKSAGLSIRCIQDEVN